MRNLAVVLFGGLLSAAIFGLAFGPRPAPVEQPAPYAILVTYCGEVPVGVIVTGDPPTFTRYEDLTAETGAGISEDRIMAFDICKAAKQTRT